ncbi:MAG TPA: aquaporin [bacterium]|nr:aquaporin [bacterium]
MGQPIGRSLVAEAVGTLALVFIGAGSIIADQLTGGRVGLVGIAFAHGLAIATMVAAAGHVSGGHFNPAVTLGFAATGRLPAGTALAYVAAQLAGASIGALLLTVGFPEAARQAVGLGTPVLARGIAAGPGIVIEAVLTFFLVFVVFGVAVDARAQRPAAPLAIGFVITMDILAGGALTGGAMNPARVFGPALFSGVWANHLVYWVGPALGGLLGAWGYTALMDRTGR